MKFIWLFIFSVILLACSKNGPNDTRQQNANSGIPIKASYYENDDAHPSEELVFNYDSLPNTVVVSSTAWTTLQPEAEYYYNTDSFLTGYKCYDEAKIYEGVARNIVIKRDQNNKVLSIITKANGPGYQSDTADVSYKYNGIYCILTVLSHGYLHNFQATDVYRLDTSVYRYIDSSHQLLSLDKSQEDKYLGYTTTHIGFSYKTDERIDSAVTTIHYNLNFGTNYIGTQTTKWVRKYSYLPGTALTGAKDYFKERLLGKDYYLAPLADLFYYNENYRMPYKFSDISLRMAPEPYISRTSPNHVSSIEITRTSDVPDLYNMPAKQIFNYTYTLGFNGRIDQYQRVWNVDGTLEPKTKVKFEY